MQVYVVKDYIKEGIKINALFTMHKDDFGEEYHKFYGELDPLIQIKKDGIINIHPSGFRNRSKNGKIQWYLYLLPCPCCKAPTYTAEVLNQ